MLDRTGGVYYRGFEEEVIRMQADNEDARNVRALYRNAVEDCARR